MQVMIVDDNPTNLAVFSMMVDKLDDVIPVDFTDPVKALEWSRTNSLDLVLLDYMMPDLNGLEFLEEFRKIPKNVHIPVIFITAFTENEIRNKALESTAIDFMTKPVEKLEFMTRVKNMLELSTYQNQLNNRAEWLADEVTKATDSLVKREREIIHRLSKAAEFRDPETGGHILRMAHYSKHIAQNLNLSITEQEIILTVASMHDIGKVGIPDHILLKPGRLEPDEMEIMKKHAEIGAEILASSSSEMIRAGAIIAGSHHEKYDGTGYPKGLKGDDIPLYGRIVAVADVFDALTSERPYKKPWDTESAKSYIRENSGKHFDPKCVEAFFTDWEKVLRIRQTFSDEMDSCAGNTIN